MTASKIDTSVWFRAEIGPRLQSSTRYVYSTWSRIADDDDLESHLHRIRDKAWPRGEYPCIGLWMFLLPGLAALPEFPTILAHAKKPQSIILDLGCGFGHHLRLLAAHDVPTDNMQALDIDSVFWDLGFDLFQDSGRMRAKFIEGNFLTINDQKGEEGGLGFLQGKVDLIIACQFLHLFSWDQQILATKKIVQLSKPGTMVVGHQQGRKTAREYIRPWGMMFYHNLDSLVKLWEQVQNDTNTTWSVNITEVDLTAWGMVEGDFDWMPEDRQGINFVVCRLS